MARLVVVTVLLALGFSTPPSSAAGGWYLLLPRVDKESSGRTVPLTQLPLKDWSHQQAFDNAPMCEREKAGQAEAWRREFQTADSSFREMALVHMVQFTASRCIASDDPRLK